MNDQPDQLDQPDQPDLSDEAEAMLLLRRVAQQNDPEAYTQLFELYQGMAFSLAYRILGNRTHAEEAVQESMLRLWRRAATFHWQGSVRSWFLCIVAHQSVRMAKRQQYQRAFQNARVPEKSERDYATPGMRIEREEQLTMLRRLLNDLPQLDRQLLSLYHETGMTQKEIGASVSLPTRTVCDRIQRTLAILRSGLVLRPD